MRSGWPSHCATLSCSSCQRTTLALLDIENELLEARASYSRAKAAQAISYYTLLTAQGKLLPQLFGVKDTAFMPHEHSDEIAWKVTGSASPQLDRIAGH